MIIWRAGASAARVVRSDLGQMAGASVSIVGTLWDAPGTLSSVCRTKARRHVVD